MNIYPFISIEESLNSKIKEIHNTIHIKVLKEKIGKNPSTPLRPSRPYEPRNHKDNSSIIMFWIIILGYFGLATLIATTSDEIEFSIIVIAFATIFNGYFFLNSSTYKAYTNEIERKISYKSDKLKYENEKIEYPKKLEAYNQQLKKHKQETKKYNQKVKNLLSSLEYELIKKTELNSAFNKLNENNLYSSFNPNFTKSIVPEGKNEKFFFAYLLKYFGKEMVFVNQQFHYYFPDFILLYPNRISIDIELDEPYTLNGKEPIHYFDSKTKERIDFKRDQFFNEKFWAVIRFSENQVKNSPDSCCKEIYKLCQFLNIPVENKFKNIEDLEIENMWNYEDSLKMAKQDFRIN